MITNSRLSRKIQCLNYTNDIKIKQKHLTILIEQYAQIINNYNVQISLLEKRNESDSVAEKIAERNSIQKQVNNYKTQQDICGKRLMMLYAALTALGFSDSNIGETYYNVDIDIPLKVSSF